MPRINLIQANSAKARIHNHLAYKLGLALIENMKRGGALKYIRFMKDVRRIKKRI